MWSNKGIKMYLARKNFLLTRYVPDVPNGFPSLVTSNPTANEVRFHSETGIGSMCGKHSGKTPVKQKEYLLWIWLGIVIGYPLKLLQTGSIKGNRNPPKVQATLGSPHLNASWFKIKKELLFNLKISYQPLEKNDNDISPLHVERGLFFR